MDIARPEIDDPCGYRFYLIEAAKNDLSSCVVMNYISCIMNQVHISSELKEVVSKHLDNAYSFAQLEINDSLESVKNLRTYFDELQNKEEKEYFCEQLYRLRCEVAILESLYGELVHHKVELIDDELKLVFDILKFGKDSPLVDGWRQAMQNIGVNPWWLELQSA